jgi:hypothetical protein
MTPAGGRPLLHWGVMFLAVHFNSSIRFTTIVHCDEDLLKLARSLQRLRLGVWK